MEETQRTNGKKTMEKKEIFDSAIFLDLKKTPPKITANPKELESLREIKKKIIR